ncbi:MAG: hypothetical protein IKO52_07510 [Clostridia bacterium]|nr:hypothetical protein [Clostridia bacterium]
MGALSFEPKLHTFVTIIITYSSSQRNQTIFTQEKRVKPMFSKNSAKILSFCYKKVTLLMNAAWEPLLTRKKRKIIIEGIIERERSLSQHDEHPAKDVFFRLYGGIVGMFRMRRAGRGQRRAAY